MKTATPAIKPAAASPLAALIALAALKKGEQLAGIVFDGEAWHLVVLLPGELKKGTWKGAVAWAKKQGGELPTRREQSLLFANLKDSFESAWYWSSEQSASDAESAWGQYFFNGLQDYTLKSVELRARAVRRLTLQ